MFIGKLRKDGNSLVLTIPREEVERFQLEAGQLVVSDVRPATVRPQLAPDLAAHAEASFRYNEAGLRALIDR